MFKLVRNYIREQKHNLLQVVGLGMLVFIMIVAFLTLNFSNNYVINQYVNDIAHNDFQQLAPFYGYENRTFLGEYDKIRQNYGSFLGNMSYYQQENNGSVIDGDMMRKATFQLRLLNGEASNPSDKRYRLIFAPEVGANVHIGDNLYAATGKTYVDFKINVPINYPTLATHDAKVAQYAHDIERYLAAGTKKTQTHYMITSSQALAYYNEHIKSAGGYEYDESDIKAQAILYQVLIAGMLYRDIQWQHAYLVHDLLITTKNFAFIETGTAYQTNLPVIVNDGGKKITSVADLANNEILIYEQFAKLNHLHIGQNYNIAGKNFIIRGYATSALTFYGGSYFANALDLLNNTIAFANSDTINMVSSELKQFAVLREDYFLASRPENAKHLAEQIDNGWVYDYLHWRYNNLGFPQDTYNSSYLTNGIDYNFLIAPLKFYWQPVTTIQQIETVKAIFTKTNLINKISGLFLSLIFTVTVVIVFIIIFKMIDRNKKLIGVLKATGYKNWQLSYALIIAIIMPLIVFALIGVGVAFPLGHYIIRVTNVNYFILIKYGWYFNFMTAFWLVSIPIISLTFVSFLMVLFLLRRKPLDLLTNHGAKTKYQVRLGTLVPLMVRYITKNATYRNKLAVTTSIRSMGKQLIMYLTTIFAATLLLFAFAASGLIGDMLGKKFAGTNFNYLNNYKFDNKIKTNFINRDNQLLYRTASVDDIQKQISLYTELLAKLQEIEAGVTPLSLNFQNRYIMGSELLQIRNYIMSHQEQFPGLVKFINDNETLIDYLTNNDGHNNDDLMLTFGMLPFDRQNELPYTQLSLPEGNFFNNAPDAKFDNVTQTLSPASFGGLAIDRILYGLDSKSTNFLTPNLTISDIDDFTNLTLEKMMKSSNWQDQQFINIRNKIIAKLGINNADSSAVQFIPMATSSLKSVVGVYTGGETLGSAIIYRYQGLDGQLKYLVTIAYDYFSKLDPNIVLVPKGWIDNILLGNKNTLLANNFANAKLSKFSTNEFRRFFPIISEENDYMIDLTKIGNDDYLSTKGMQVSLAGVGDIANLRAMLQTSQYSMQTIITFFGFFSVILSLMIITIVTNIIVRDNLILINILRSLGYTASEVSYNFLVVMLPLLILSSCVAVVTVPPLVTILADLLRDFNRTVFNVVFRWWYYALMIAINLLIYLVAYIITWKLNVNNKQLMNLTK